MIETETPILEDHPEAVKTVRKKLENLAKVSCFHRIFIANLWGIDPSFSSHNPDDGLSKFLGERAKIISAFGETINQLTMGEWREVHRRIGELSPDNFNQAADRIDQLRPKQQDFRFWLEDWRGGFNSMQEAALCAQKSTRICPDLTFKDCSLSMEGRGRKETIYRAAYAAGAALIELKEGKQHFFLDLFPLEFDLSRKRRSY